jgi:hypothetical protein
VPKPAFLTQLLVRRVACTAMAALSPPVVRVLMARRVLAPDRDVLVIGPPQLVMPLPR